MMTNEQVNKRIEKLLNEIGYAYGAKARIAVNAISPAGKPEAQYWNEVEAALEDFERRGPAERERIIAERQARAEEDRKAAAEAHRRRALEEAERNPKSLREIVALCATAGSELDADEAGRVIVRGAPLPLTAWAYATVNKTALIEYLRNRKNVVEVL